MPAELGGDGGRFFKHPGAPGRALSASPGRRVDAELWISWGQNGENLGTERAQHIVVRCVAGVLVYKLLKSLHDFEDILLTYCFI